MAGRPRANTLYKKKGRSTWLYYKPGFGTVDTGHVDRTMAERAMKGMPAPSEPSMFKIDPPIAEIPVDPIRAALNTVAQQTAGDDPFSTASDAAADASGNESGGDGVRLSPSPEPDKLSKPELAVLRKLSGAKREKIIGLLGTGAARLNATLVATSFGIVGFKFKDDYAGLSDDDLEIMKLGYDMWLDDVLDNIELKPAYVILIGNALMAVGMFPHLERKPKKTKLHVVPGGGSDNGTPTG